MLGELTNVEFSFTLGGKDYNARGLTLHDLSRLEQKLRENVKAAFKEEMEFIGEVLTVDERKEKFIEANKLIKSIGVGTPEFDKHIQEINNVSYILYLSLKKSNDITYEQVCDMLSISELGSIEIMLTRLLGMPEVEKSESKKAVDPHQE